MISRRTLAIALATAGSTSAHTVRSQSADRHYRIGWVAAFDSFNEPYSLAFVQRLRELGFEEGRNLIIERRHPNSRLEDMPAITAALSRLKCDAYFSAGGDFNLSALTHADRLTPIVFIAVDFDPVAAGVVSSLARPGGRLTGVTAIQSALPAKRLELLRELLPHMGRVSVLTNEQTVAQLAVTESTAKRLALALHIVDLKRPPFDYDAAFDDVSRHSADALFVLGSGLWVPARRLITDRARRMRLPTVFHHAQWVEAGGLMSYGFNFIGMWRRGAEMMAQVLRGTKPGDIPMEQPSVYELAFNQKTARSLNIKIPQSLLVRADRVID
jgi:putative ABC transport system substrate-binding protein